MSNSKSLSFSKRLVAGILSFVTCAAVICAPASEALPEILSSQNLSMSASAANRSSSITASSGNVTLYAGDYLQNGDFKAILQSDGNFVVYNTKKNQAVWHSGTYYRSKYSNYRLVVQSDGNLVLYAKKGNNNSYWLWTTATSSSSLTCGNGYNFSLALSNTGRLSFTQTYRGMSSTTYEKWANDSKKIERRIDKMYQNDYNGILYGGTCTIKKAGCALTSYAMIYNLYNGTSKTPVDLNNSRYVSNGDTKFKGCTDIKYSPSCNQIAEQLKTNPTIVFLTNGVSYDNGGKSHFVVVYGCTRKSGTVTTSDLLVADPAIEGYTTLAQSIARMGSGVYIGNSRTWCGDSQW